MYVTEIAPLPAVFVRQLARFGRFSPFTSSMGTATALGIRPGDLKGNIVKGQRSASQKTRDMW
jgi:hypothetical protein